VIAFTKRRHACPGSTIQRYFGRETGQICRMPFENVDFTVMSTETDPVEVMILLSDLFSEFNTLVEGHSLEKINTIGDAFMVDAGPETDESMPAAGLMIVYSGMRLSRERPKSILYQSATPVKSAP
jgi:hypothetical protein